MAASQNDSLGDCAIVGEVAGAGGRWKGGCTPSPNARTPQKDLSTARAKGGATRAQSRDHLNAPIHTAAVLAAAAAAGGCYCRQGNSCLLGSCRRCSGQPAGVLRCPARQLQPQPGSSGSPALQPACCSSSHSPSSQCLKNWNSGCSCSSHRHHHPVLLLCSSQPPSPPACSSQCLKNWNSRPSLV